jgi:hypothetical protein
MRCRAEQCFSGIVSTGAATFWPMKYKRIEYKILQTTSRGIWAWSFDPPKAIPVIGRSKGGRPDAIAAVQRAIDKWHKSKAVEAQDGRTA